MSRINTNIQSLLATRILGQQNQGLTRSMERLSTGLAINRGSDNPAGLIASEALRSQVRSIDSAIGNAQRAEQVVNIAEGGLQEVSALLLEIQGLVTESANAGGLSSDELQANQLQVDSILQTIDRIAATTSFQGTKLLNGTYEFTITGQNAGVDDYQVDAAILGHNETRTINTIITASARHGSVFLSAGDANATPADRALNFGKVDITDRFIFEVIGTKGSREFTFASATKITDIATSINGFKDITGVSAVASAHFLELKSTEFGLNQFVSVNIVDDASGNIAGGRPFAAATTDEDVLGALISTVIAATSPVRRAGQDVAGMINGIAGSADGTVISVNSDALALTLDLDDTAATTIASFDAFTITAPGAKFSIGPTVDIANQVGLGLGNIASRKLGSFSTGNLDTLTKGGSNDLIAGNRETAQKVVDAAIAQVSTLRGRLGAFQKNVLQSTINALGVARENTAAAESITRDTDFAGETASLTRAQILVNASTNVLAIANAQPQSVLRLLG